MKYEEIRANYQSIESRICQVDSLLRADLNVDMTYVMIEKHKLEARENKKRLIILKDSLEKEKKEYVEKVMNVARTFNDVEEELFVDVCLKGMTLNAAADDIGICYNYARHLNARIKKEMEEIGKERNEDNDN